MVQIILTVVLHEHTSTRTSHGAYQSVWHNHVWYHLFNGRIVTTTLDSQLSIISPLFKQVHLYFVSVTWIYFFSKTFCVSCVFFFFFWSASQHFRKRVEYYSQYFAVIFITSRILIIKNSVLRNQKPHEVTIYLLIDWLILLFYGISTFSGYLMPISVGFIISCLHHVHKWNVESFNSLI